jgi:uncharacterized protein
MVEVVRNTPADRPVLQKYRGGGFTVSGDRYDGAIIVLPTRVVPWPVTQVTDMDSAGLTVLLREAGVALCLIGCGPRMVQLPTTTRQVFKDAGLSIDTMETGAACRTFNMLAAEGRAVGAALIPLP